MWYDAEYEAMLKEEEPVLKKENMVRAYQLSPGDVFAIYNPDSSLKALLEFGHDGYLYEVVENERQGFVDNYRHKRTGKRVAAIDLVNREKIEWEVNV